MSGHAGRGAGDTQGYEGKLEPHHLLAAKPKDVRPIDEELLETGAPVWTANVL